MIIVLSSGYLNSSLRDEFGIGLEEFIALRANQHGTFLYARKTVFRMRGAVRARTFDKKITAGFHIFTFRHRLFLI
jgi:hypothetical protein